MKGAIVFGAGVVAFLFGALAYDLKHPSEAEAGGGGIGLTCGTGTGGAVCTASPTLTGTLTAAGISAVTGVFSAGVTLSAGPLAITGQAYVNMPTVGTTAGTGYTVNWDNGNGQTFDAQGSSGNITFTFSNPHAGASYVLKLIQGSSARTYTWPAAVKWPGGTAPTVTATNDGVDIISCFYDEAATYRCSASLDVK